MRHRRLRHRGWWKSLTKPLLDRKLWIPCRDTVANGVAIGLFFAMMPMPFQMLAAGVMAMRFKVNVPFALASCWVTNPLTQVPIWVAQHQFGSWLRNSLEFPMPAFLVNVNLNLPGAGSVNAASFLLGVIFSGIILAVLTFPVTHVLSRILPHHLPVRVVRAVRRRRGTEVEEEVVESPGEGI